MDGSSIPERQQPSMSTPDADSSSSSSQGIGIAHADDGVPTVTTALPSLDALTLNTSAASSSSSTSSYADPSFANASSSSSISNSAPPTALPTAGGLGVKTRKRPARLSLAPPASAFIAVGEGGMIRSVPNSPVRALSVNPKHVAAGTQTAAAEQQEHDARALRDNLRGAPRRRPSMPFAQRASPPKLSLDPNHQGVSNASASQPSATQRARPPSIWQDPSEHILSGKGSTLQHARSVYAAGPVEVLPGLYLGDEHNACDVETLSDLGITTILNVAKETELPFQSEASDTTGAALRIPTRSTATQTPHPPNTAAVPAHLLSPNRFYTPYTSMFPPSALNPPPLAPKTPGLSQAAAEAAAKADAGEPSPPQFLRNTTSTPNLQLAFKGQAASSTTPTQLPLSPSVRNAGGSASISAVAVGMGRGSLRGPGAATEELSESEEGATTAGSSEASSTAETVTTVGTSPPSPNIALHAMDLDIAAATADDGAGATAKDTSDAPTSVPLPTNALAMAIPASPLAGRMLPLRYVKLPWTHDETDLAQPTGGFDVGCALIAETLRVGPFSPSPTQQQPQQHEQMDVDDDAEQFGKSVSSLPPPPPGKILVHCQCGVSRSATLVIAFVMQAAALSYPLEGASGLTGMHDCYTLVKDISASISPNVSLIYQLVEWERYLSAEVHRLRELLGLGSVDGTAASTGATVDGAAPAAAGWAGEAMGEEEWTRMRLEEEQKEEAEESRIREQRLEVARKAAAERRAAEEAERSAGAGEEEESLGGLPGGLGARRRKRTPNLTLGASKSSSPSSSEAPSSDSAELPPLPTSSLPGMSSLGSGRKAGGLRKGPPKPLTLKKAAVETPLATAYATPMAFQGSDDEFETGLATPSASHFNAAARSSAAAAAAASGSAATVMSPDEDAEMANASPTGTVGPAALARSQSDGVPLPSSSQRLSPRQLRRTPLASDSSASMRGSSTDVRDRRRSVQVVGAQRSGIATPPLQPPVDPRRRSVQALPGSSSISMSISPSAPPGGFSFGGGGSGSPASSALTPSRSLHSFGASRQSALERKDRHKRTFSSDLPASLRAFSREVGVKLEARKPV